MIFHHQNKRQINTNTLENNNNNDNIEEEIKENVIATKIVNALSESLWLGVSKKKKYFAGAYERDKYKALTEFPVYTGTTKHSRRIDVLIAENLRVENHYSLNLNLHGIEIKVSKSDFEKDKMHIYREVKRLNPTLIKDSLTTLSLRLI